MTIYLEPDEEITAIVDHLIRAEAKEIVLVIPMGAQILQSLVNLKLLKREADNLKKKIIIVSQDQAGQRMAEKAGLEVRFSKDEFDFIEKERPRAFDSVQDEKKEEVIRAPLKMADIIRPQVPEEKELERPVKIKYQAEAAEEEIKEVEELEKAWISKRIPKIKLPQIEFNQFNLRALLIVFLSVLFITVILTGWLVFPKAEIILHPRMEDVSLDLQVLADLSGQVDLSQNRIAAHLIKLEKRESREFPATGEKQLNEKAHGVITIYNQYSSSPQTLLEKTRFLSEGGKLFRTTKTIVVPGARIEEGKIVPSTIDVEVLADRPGSDYNIPPSRFTIPGFKGSPKFNGFYGVSKAAMTGGSTEKVKIFSQEDFDGAKEKLIKDLREKIYQELKEQIPSGLKLLDQAIQEKDIQILSSPEVGNQAEKFTLTLNMKIGALVFNEKDLEDLIENRVVSQISEEKEPFRESLKINFNQVKTDFDKGIINLKINAQEKISWKIDIDDLKKNISGKNEREIKDIFSQKPEIASARISFWPFWVKNVPKRLNRIKIEISYNDLTKFK